MDWTEILTAVITAVVGAVVSVGIPLLVYFLKKRTTTIEDETVRDAVDELIDDAGQLITDIVSSLVETDGVQTLSLAQKDGKVAYETAITTVNELLSEESKDAIKERTNNHYDKYIEIKVKATFYKLSHQQEEVSTDA